MLEASEDPTEVGPRSTRRQAIRVAGASAAVAVAGAVVTAQPAAAADPNDVVKNVDNTTTARTGLTGSFGGDVLRVENTSDFSNARAIYARSGARDVGAVRGDNLNDETIGGVGVSGYAPGGRDFLAFGSGRIGLNSHLFNLATRDYTTGEIHQSGGTLYAMVSPTVRRSLAGPASAGALYPIDPVRVYDSRRPQPDPGTIVGGSSRVVSVADARNLSTGAVITSDVVPVGATAVVFNLTVTGGAAAGFLAIASGSASTYNASIINFAAAQTIANASTVKLDASRQVKVFCVGGPVHFILDISGYYL